MSSTGKREAKESITSFLKGLANSNGVITCNHQKAVLRPNVVKQGTGDGAEERGEEPAAASL